MGASKGVPILISLNARFGTEGQPEDALQLITNGELFEDAGQTVIRYEESLEEDAPPQKVEVSVKNDVVTITRQSAYNPNMVFQKGRRYESQYQTPYGAMDMALYCTKATHTADSSGGEINLQYQLDLTGQYATMHHMTLQYMRKRDL